MSTNNDQAEANEEVCASCGIAAGSDTKLRKCTACKLVKYCSVECQKNHRPKHKKACKKQAAALRDEILFKQPESTHDGDCPICCIPLSLDLSKSIMMPCCSKTICNGCDRANQIREFTERQQQKCPYCRLPRAPSNEEIQQYRQKRIEANDDIAIRQLGTQLLGQGDYVGAVEQWKKAAEMGNTRAHYELSVMYQHGRGVEQDLKKAKHHLEVAAIGGNPKARHYLGNYEYYVVGNRNRALKHWIIAAKQGYTEALETVTEMHGAGVIPLGLYENTYRGYEAAIEATKSPQREEAEAAAQEQS